MMIKRFVLLGALSVAAPAEAVQVEIDVTNLAASDGTALSPFFIGIHDGSFDAFDQGMAASTGVEAVAELGDGSGLAAEFATSQPSGLSGTVTAMSGAFGPGIFLPGGNGSITLDLDPSMHRYLTYASMVVPSNDYFIGNDSPTAIELFDAAGNFTGNDVIVTADQIWNAGTEVDDPANGPAFVAGQDATVGAAEGGIVSPDEDLSIFSGVATPAGYEFTAIPAGNADVARLSFSVVPEPSGIFLILVGATVAYCFSFRRHGETVWPRTANFAVRGMEGVHSSKVTKQRRP